MPLSNYGVLKGRVSAVETEPEDTRSPHVHATLEAEGKRWIASLNVKSRAGLTEQDKWLLFHVSANFRHPITQLLPALTPGFHRLPSGDLRGLDYIRQNLVERERMRPLPPEAMPGDEGDDLNEALAFYLTQAQRRGADCYVFGHSVTDWRTGQMAGVHDVHLNQGSDAHGPYAATNGTYQDGALLIHHRLTRRTLETEADRPRDAPVLASRWIALFLAFQAQAWHTDEVTGHPLTPFASDNAASLAPNAHVPDGAVRLVAARLASGDHPATVTLLSAATIPLDLTGWQICDASKTPTRLRGLLRAGQTRVFRLRPPARLHPRGGYLSLLNERGWKVDGVSYTSAKVREGGVIVF